MKTKKSSVRPPASCWLAVVLTLAAASISGHAATFGWSGSGTGPGTGAGTAWLTAGNWTNNAGSPTNADIAFFGSAGSGTNIGFNFNAPAQNSTNIGAITLGSDSTNRFFGNSSTTAGIQTRWYHFGLGGGLFTNLSANRAMVFNLFAGGSGNGMTNVLMADGRIHTEAGGIVFNTSIGEAGGARTITKTGPGTLTLNLQNTISGKMIVNAGTLAIGDENRLGGNPGASSADTLTLDGGTLTATAAVTIDDGNRGIRLGPAHGNFAGNQNITLSRPISGPGNLTNNSSATLILNSTANTYSGRTILRAGVTRAINDNSFGAVPGSYLADAIIFENNAIFLNQDSEFNIHPNRGITINSSGGRLQSGFARSWGVNSVIAGSGVLTISADPTPAYVRLNANNTFTNDLIVNNNTGGSWALASINGSIAAGGRVRVTTNGWLLGTGTIHREVIATNGATLGGGEIGTPGTLTINGTLNLTNAILSLDETVPGTVGSGINDLLQVNGNLNLAGVVVVRPTALLGTLTPGTYRLINYTGTLTGSAANLAADADGYMVTFDTTTPGEVNMTVAGTPTLVKWTGAGGPVWNVNQTVSWDNGMGPSVFLQGQDVLFDNTGDYGIGLNPLPITMFGPSANFNSLLPGRVTVDAAANVTITSPGGSAGKLGGGMSLTKRGAGALTLNTGNGNFPNDYTGPTVVEGGILRPGYARAFGATNGPTLATNGGTLDVNGQSLGAEPFVASGAGVGGNGAIINLGGGQNNALRYLTLAGDTVVGGVGRWDVRDYTANNLTGARVQGGGHSLIKTGVNQISFVSVGDTDLGDITVQQGTLQFEGNATMGRATDEVTVMPDATLGFWGSTVFNLKWVRTDNGARVFKDNGNTTNLAPVTLLGGVTRFDVNNNSGNIYALNGQVNGAGGLSKVGTGTLQLAGTNTYTGNTFVSNGTLQVMATGSISNSPLLDVRGGAVLDVTQLAGAGGFKLAAGQTLMGAGSVLGSVTADPGTTLVPGGSPGTLSVNSNLAINGAALTFELGAATTEGGGVNDLIVARDLAFSGLSTLRVLPVATLTTGSPYTLFRSTNAFTGGSANLSVVHDTRYTFALADVPPNLIQLTASGSPATLGWVGGTFGAEMDWDLTTANWDNVGLPDTFFTGDTVLFDDFAAVFTVKPVGTIHAGPITVNSATDYLFTGTGNVASTAPLTKSSPGRLILDTDNPNLLGAITLSAGTLELGNGGARGSIPASVAIANSGTLVVNRSDVVTIANAVTGAGGITKEGAGATAFTANNSVRTGPVTVNAGTLRFGHSNAFGAGGILFTVNNGGAIDLNGVAQLNRFQSYTLAGAGPDGSGALNNTGGGLFGNAGISNLTLAADATLGVSNSGGRYDIGTGNTTAGQFGAFDGNNFTLTKVGPGAVALRVPSAEFPQLIVSNGLFYGENFDTNLAANILVHSNGNVGTFGARSNLSAVTLYHGATLMNVGGSADSVWYGPLTNLGPVGTLNVTGPSGNGNIRLFGNVHGAGLLDVRGGNNRNVDLLLDNSATYAGAWSVQGGTLLRAFASGAFGAGPITNLGTVDFLASTPYTYNNGIHGGFSGGVVNFGLVRHLTNGGAVTLGGNVQAANIQAQGGGSNNAAPLTFAPGAQVMVTGTLSAGHANTGGRMIFDNATLNLGNLFLGEQASQTGIVSHVNATVTVTNQVRLGHWPTEVSPYVMDGGSFTVTVDPAANPSGAGEQNGGFYIGVDGVASFTQNSGTLTTPDIVLDNRGSTVLAPNTNTYTLNGGTLVLGRWGIQSPNATYQINLGGGVIESSANWTSTLRMTLTGTNGDVAFNPASGRTNTLSGALSGPGGLIKNGGGTLLLHGQNTFAGTVTVNNGTLGGNGTLSAPLLVNAGGTLAPGVSPGVLTVTNSVTLSGTTAMEVSRTGLTLANDRLVVVSGTLTFGGALIVTSIGQAPVGGEVFDLFDWSASSGTFSSVTLPPLASHLSWDDTQLYIDGTLRVVGTPSITTPPANQVAYECDNVVFRAVVEHFQPFTLQWQKGGVDIAGANAATLSLTNVQLGDAATYTLIASNASGSNMVSATLTVLEATNLHAGLIAYYPLDDLDTNANTTADTTANMQTLASSGLQASNVLAGVRSNSFIFNGAASNLVSRVHTGGEALPAYNYPAYSVAFWVRGNFSGQSDRRVFSEGSTTDNDPILGLGTHVSGTGPQVDVFIRNTDGVTPVNHVLGTKAAFDGNWHHVTWVDNNGAGALYVDGLLDTNINYARGSLALNTIALANLRRAAVGVGFSGQMDDVMVWRRSLKSNEVFCVMTNSLNGPPVITTPPASQTVECSSNAIFTVAVSSLDLALTYQWLLGGAPIPDATNSALSFPTTATSGGNYQVIVGNCAGFTTSSIAVLTIQDTIAPDIACPAAVTVQCDADVPAVNLGTVTATDACDATPTVTHAGDVTNGVCPKTITRTYQAVDDAGNTNTCAQIITVHDTMPPVPVCPPNLIVDCDSDVPPANFAGGSVTDNCDPSPVVTHEGDVPGGSCPKIITRTYRATDACGNTNFCSQTILVRPPAFAQDALAGYAAGALDGQAYAGTGFATGGSWTSGGGTAAVSTSGGLGHASGGLTLLSSGGKATTPAAGFNTVFADLDATDGGAFGSRGLVEAGSGLIGSGNVGGTLYYSFLARSGATDLPNGTDDFAAVELYNGGAEVFGVGNNFGAWAYSTFGIGGDGDLLRPSDSTFLLVDSSTHLFVVKIQFVAGGNDTVTVWMDPDLSVAEGIQPNTVYRRTVAGNATFNRIALRSGSLNNDNSWDFDEIRFGSTWGAVTPLLPVIACPANATVQCGASEHPSNTGFATASDRCGALTPAWSDTTTPGANCAMDQIARTIARVWTATDPCGASVTCTQTITVIDTTAPALTCGTDFTVQAGTAWTFTTPSATDNCTPSGSLLPVVSSTLTNPACGLTFTATRVWQVTDDCGNSTLCTQVVTVVDTVAPMLACPPNTNVQCLADVPPADFAGGSVSDAGDPAPVVAHVGDSAVGVNPTIITRTYRAVDACMNTSTCDQVITVLDTTPPVIGACPPNQTLLDTDGSGDEVATYATPTATDNCGMVSVACVPPSGSTLNVGTHTVTCTATDAAGNTNACTFLVVVSPPTSADVYVDDDYAGLPNGTLVTWPHMAGGPSFIIGIDAAATIQRGHDSVVPGGTVHVAPGAYAENVAITRLITLRGSGCGANPAVDTVVTATNPALPVLLLDDIGGSNATARLTIEDLRATGGADGIRATAMSAPLAFYRFDNVAGANNTGSGVTLDGPQDMSDVQVAGCKLNDNGLAGLRIATGVPNFARLEVTGGEMKNNFTHGLSVNAAGSDATDASHHYTDLSVDGTTFENNGAPIQPGSGDLSFFRVNGNVMVKNVGITADGQFPIQLRGEGSALPGTWAAAGTVLLQNVTIGGTGARPGLYIVRYADVSAITIDNVSLAGYVPPSLPSGFASAMQVIHSGVAPLNLGSLTLPCNPTPAGYGALAMLGSGGATATCQTVIVGATTVAAQEACVFDFDDTNVVGNVTFPNVMVSCPSVNLTNECTSPAGAVVTFTVTGASDCDPMPVVSCAPLSGSTFPLGTTPVNCTVTDNRGISATCSFTVTVVDTTAPSIVCPADMTLECATPAGTVAVFAPMAADTCDTNLTLLCAPPSGAVFPPGTNTVVCWAIDDSGNSNSCSFAVVVRDTTPPSIVCPADYIASILGGTITGPVVYPPVTGTDACGTPVVVCTPPSGSILPLGPTLVTCVATDGVGLTNACSFTVTVQRSPIAAPDLMGAFENHTQNVRVVKLLLNDSDEDGDPITLSAVGALSLNGGAVTLDGAFIRYVPAPGFSGTDFFNYTLTDGQGGSATGTVEVRVRDESDPSLNQIGGIEVTPGGVKVRFAGIPGRSYSLERSTNLVVWSQISTVTAPEDGVIEFLDTMPPGGMGFYRVVAP